MEAQSGVTIQQWPTNMTQQREKNISGQSDWDINTNRRKPKLNSEKRNHHQLQPTGRSPHWAAKTLDDKDVKAKMPSSPLAPSSPIMTHTKLPCCQAGLAAIDRCKPRNSPAIGSAWAAYQDDVPCRTSQR
jgi:hypothetical protein